jgi:hypothetical protein
LEHHFEHTPSRRDTSRTKATPTKISGVSFDEALDGSKTFELDGYPIP